MAQRENNKLPKVSKSRTARTSNDLQLNNCRTYKINDGLQFSERTKTLLPKHIGEHVLSDKLSYANYS